MTNRSESRAKGPTRADELNERLDRGELDLLLTSVPSGLTTVEEVELVHDPFVVGA